MLATDGRLRWRGEIVAELAEGDSLYRPRLIMLADETLTGPDLERVQDRLALWLRHHVNTVLEQVMALEAPADLDGAGRGIAYQLYEHLGLLPRAVVADEVKGLDQDVRGKMRKLGIKFGAYHIYLPLSLKPAPRELALILFALKNGGVRQPGVSDIPHIVLSGRTSFLVDPEVDPRLYEIAGFKVAGKRAVRIDILERLADIIRPLIAIDPARHQGELPAGAAEGNGFRVTVEMTSLLAVRAKISPRSSPRSAIACAARPRSWKPRPGGGFGRSPGAGTGPGRGAGGDVVDAVAEPQAGIETVPGPADGVIDETPVAPAAEAAPAEPQFDEVWFPGGRRHNDNNHRGRQPRREGDAEGQNQGRRPERARPEGRGPRRPNGDARQGDTRTEAEARQGGKPPEQGPARAGRPPRARRPAPAPRGAQARVRPGQPLCCSCRPARQDGLAWPG